MAFETTKNIWHNGQMIAWDKAQVHVMSHVIHYGSSVFEGMRCYAQPNGAAIFRLRDHMRRMLDSAKIYRMPLGYTLEELCSAAVDVVEANGVAPCYIRPIAFRGYGEVGVNPLNSPVEVYIVNYPWGKYVSGSGGADVCISSWEPARAQHHAVAGQGGRKLHELATDPHGGGDQRLLGGDRAGCERLSLRGFGREPLPGARWHSLHHAAGQLRAVRNYAQPPC